VGLTVAGNLGCMLSKHKVVQLCLCEFAGKNGNMYAYVKIVSKMGTKMWPIIKWKNEKIIMSFDSHT